MDSKSDDHYEKELEEAIKLSLANFTQPKKNHKEDVPMEEEKGPSFFDEKDLLPTSSFNYEFPVSSEDAKGDDLFWEESKEPTEVLSQNPPRAVDPNKELLKEYMVVMETHIFDTEEFVTVLEVLKKLIGNILKDPNESKFHKIKLSNKKIQETIGRCAPALFLLELIGFKRSKEDEIVDVFTIKQVDCYILDYESFLIENFECLDELIQERLSKIGDKSTNNFSMTVPTGPAGDKPKTYDATTGYNNKYVPMNSKRRQQMEKLANQKKTNKDMLFELAQQRQKRKYEQPQLYQNNPYAVTNVPTESTGGSSVWDQLKAYRKSMKEKNMYRQSKEITIKDLEAMNRDESMNVDPNDIKRLGIR